MKDIPGYESLFAITEDGKVWRHGHFIEPGKKKSSHYETVSFAGKCLYTHRLLALTYLSNPLNLPQVNHKNGNKRDNRIENLEWISQAKNVRHAWRVGLNKAYPREGAKNPAAKLTEEQVRYIRKQLANPQASRVELCKVFGISYSTLKKIRNRSTWQAKRDVVVK